MHTESPLRPGSPGIPLGPCGPRDPGIPSKPLNPLSPGSPFCPGLPFGGTLTDICPFSPFCPCLPSFPGIPYHTTEDVIQILLLSLCLVCSNVKPGFHTCVSRTHNGARCLMMYEHQ